MKSGSLDFAPICLFVYNRPYHTEQTIKHLKNNYLASQSELFVFSDGPKDEKANSKVNETRGIVHSISGFKKVHITEREENFGLARSIIEGVTKVINVYDKAIVLEDDLITSPYFLKFLNNGLQLYESEPYVASIHGYTYPVTDKLPSTFFIKGADCWGWATWKRAWVHFEPDGLKLLKRLNSKELKREFNFNNSYPYVKLLKNQIAGKNNSWAIRWYASAFLKNMYTLYPYPSLVSNIGFDNSGMHSGVSKVYTNALPTKPIEIKIIPIAENILARKAFEKFFRRQNNPINLSIRVLNKIKSILTK